MKRSCASTNRQGAALIAALVVMAVLSVILTVVIVQVVKQRQFVSQRQRQLQAEWLTRAGVELAVARLLETPAAFSDDKQELAPDARVRIVVEKAEQDLFAVTVDAEVGLEEGPTVVRTRQAKFRRVDLRGVIRLQAVALD